MTKPIAPNREFSSRTISHQRAEMSASTIRPERSVLHSLSNTSDGDTEIAITPSRSTSPTLRTPEKSFRKVNTSLLSPSLDGVKRSERIAARYQSKEANVTTNGDGQSSIDTEAVINQLKEENSSLKERILMVQESLSRELQIERDKNKYLIERLEDVERQLDTAKKEQEATIELFAEERNYREREEENLKKKLRDASSTIQDLTEKLDAAQNCHKR